MVAVSSIVVKQAAILSMHFSVRILMGACYTTTLQGTLENLTNDA